MARPQLNKKEDIAVNQFPFGSVSLVHSDDLGMYAYGGSVQVPQVLPETRIRIVEAHQPTAKSPDYAIDYLAPDNDNNPVWVQGAGSGWYKPQGTMKKDGSGVSEKDRIEVVLQIGTGGATVRCALFPADIQPPKNEHPDWYDAKTMGPLVWRVAYNPPRAAIRMKAAAQPQAFSGDKIPY